MNTYNVILALINFASIVFIALAIMRLAARVKAFNDRIKMDQLSRAYGGTFRVQPAGTNQLRAQIDKLDEIIAKKDAKLLKRGDSLERLRASLTESRKELSTACDMIDEHEKTIESLSVTSDTLSLENEQLKYHLSAANYVLRSNGFNTLHIRRVDPGNGLDPTVVTEYKDKEIIRTSTAYNGDRIDWFKEAISESEDTPRKPYVVPERDCIGHISTTNETVKDHNVPIMKVDASALDDIDFRGEKPKVSMTKIVLETHRLIEMDSIYKEHIKGKLSQLGVKYTTRLKPEQYGNYYKFLTELSEKVKK